MSIFYQTYVDIPRRFWKCNKGDYFLHRYHARQVTKATMTQGVRDCREISNEQRMKRLIKRAQDSD